MWQAIISYNPDRPRAANKDNHALPTSVEQGTREAGKTEHKRQEHYYAKTWLCHTEAALPQRARSGGQGPHSQPAGNEMSAL